MNLEMKWPTVATAVRAMSLPKGILQVPRAGGCGGGALRPSVGRVAHFGRGRKTASCSHPRVQLTLPAEMPTLPAKFVSVLLQLTLPATTVRALEHVPQEGIDVLFHGICVKILLSQSLFQ